MKPKIGLTIGDLAGVGLEIINKSIPAVKDICDTKVIGHIPEKIDYGKVNSLYGWFAGQAISQAIDSALKGDIDAVVTAPINKEAFNAGGWEYPGHTEMFAALTKTANYSMMLIHGNMRVVHVTTHIPLRDVPDVLSSLKIFHKIQTAYDACRDLGIEDPYIGVCGLNPHCSDGGLFGDEEKEVIQPAIEYAREYGFRVAERPIPADVAFAKMAGGAYDCVVAMYHDQGHIPIKTMGFTWNNGEWDKVDGVNMTCGLPIIRTSPDHGVAFGKAGKGIADPTSMINAIKVAVEVVKNRHAKRTGK